MQALLGRAASATYAVTDAYSARTPLRVPAGTHGVPAGLQLRPSGHDGALLSVTDFGARSSGL